MRTLRFEQWVFAGQWADLRAYAAERGVLFFGDLPIFVSHDSADVWASRELFELDETGRPTTVSGVPPDYFAAEGQRWNNPHYDWKTMAADGFAWWRRRIARQRELFDLVRIDHFRGFEAAWHVPVDAASAREGFWVPGPAREVLAALVETAGPGTLVAEDLPDRIGRYLVLEKLGKGGMGEKTRLACQKFGCVYLHAVGGAAQVLAEAIKEVQASGRWKNPIVTTIEPVKNWAMAEGYHQDYLVKNPGGYTCHFERSREL